MEEDRVKISDAIKRVGDQPGAASNVKIPKEAYTEASNFLKHAGRDDRFSVGSDKVYDMLRKSIRKETEREELLGGWRKACESLIRYALNLFLAPRKQEYRKLRLSSSFFVNNVEKNLKNAKFFLEAMGYAEKEKGELQYDGNVEMSKVLDVLTDLVILSSEIDLILKTKNCYSIEDAIKARSDVSIFQGEQEAGPSSMSSEKSVDDSTGQEVDEIESEGSKEAQPPAPDPSALPEPAFNFSKNSSSNTKTMGDRSHSADNLLSNSPPGLDYQRSQSSDDGSQNPAPVPASAEKKLVTSQSVDIPDKERPIRVKPVPAPRKKIPQEAHSGSDTDSSPISTHQKPTKDKVRKDFWECGYCTQLNSSSSTRCKICGHITCT